MLLLLAKQLANKFLIAVSGLIFIQIKHYISLPKQLICLIIDI